MATASVSLTHTAQNSHAVKTKNVEAGSGAGRAFAKVEPSESTGSAKALKVFAVALIIIGVAFILAAGAVGAGMLFAGKSMVLDFVAVPVLAALGAKWSIVAASIAMALGIYQLSSGIIALRNDSESFVYEDSQQTSQTPAQSEDAVNSNMQAGSIQPFEIISTKDLINLVLNHGKATVFPPIVGRLTSIQRLELTHNELETLPDHLSNLVNLYDLNVSNNKLESLPAFVSNFGKLQILKATHNQLKEVPSELCQCGNLRMLDLSNNPTITSLPENLGDLKKLRVLNLRDCKLTKLPHSIGELEDLELLDLRGNALTQLPESFGNLKKLKYLILDRNQLESLPKSFTKLESLARLSVDGNPLKEKLVNTKATVYTNSREFSGGATASGYHELYTDPELNEILRRPQIIKTIN
jgi:hypothetical protein